MVAKHGSARLCLRVSLSIKENLEKFAFERGSSLSAAVEGLLTEQLASPVGLDVNISLLIARAQLRAYEGLHAFAAAADETTRSRQLSDLHNVVLESFRAREENVREISLRRAASKKLHDGEPATRGNPFAGLAKEKQQAVGDRLDVYGRRRKRFGELLERVPVGTKKELAQWLGLKNQSPVTHYRTGRQRIDEKTARKIERFLGVPVGELDKIEVRSDIAELQAGLEKLSKLRRRLGGELRRSQRKR